MKLVFPLVIIAVLENAFCSPILDVQISEPNLDIDAKEQTLLLSNIDEQGAHFEGDILLTLSQLSGMTNEKYRWPSGRIPFVLDTAFSQTEVATIQSGMQEISSKTCIRFYPKTTETNYVYIRKGDPGSGCNSNVGRIGGQQTVNFQVPGCLSKGIVAHELIHTIGFRHEHSRTDRDDYIAVNWDNVKPAYAYAFNKYGSDVINPFGVPYDYASIMHYSAFAFAVNNQSPTLTSRTAGVTIGQRKNLSPYDAKKINNMYRC